MHVWLVKLEDSLPVDDAYRPYRMGMLAEALITAGHTVTRWASDYQHLLMHADDGVRGVLRAP